VYDAYPGGVGLSGQAYMNIEELLLSVQKLLKECICKDGCPRCVQSPKCGNNNQPLDKEGALMILNQLLG
ncbi:MAG: Zn-binding domain-containing protein, partial [Armatimonadota bacterium]